jgi:hypothetical protein
LIFLWKSGYLFSSIFTPLLFLAIDFAPKSNLDVIYNNPATQHLYSKIYNMMVLSKERHWEKHRTAIFNFIIFNLLVMILKVTKINPTHNK